MQQEDPHGMTCRSWDHALGFSVSRTRVCIAHLLFSILVDAVVHTQTLIRDKHLSPASALLGYQIPEPSSTAGNFLCCKAEPCRCSEQLCGFLSCCLPWSPQGALLPRLFVFSLCPILLFPSLFFLCSSQEHPFINKHPGPCLLNSLECSLHMRAEHECV